MEFLSLFLIPFVMALMARKRGRTEASTSDENRIVFTRDMFEDDFNFNNLLNVIGCRAMRIERRVNLAVIKRKWEMNFVKYFENNGWESLCDLMEIVRPDMVRYFYGNMITSSLDDLTFVTKCYGVRIEVTKDTIANILGVAENEDGIVLPYQVEDPNRPSMDDMIRELCIPEAPRLIDRLPSLYLTNEVSTLNLIISYNLDPHDHKGNLIKSRAEILYHIVRGDPVNLPAPIMRTMILATRHSRSSSALPFPQIVMAILRVARICIPKRAEIEKPKEIIDATSITRSVNKNEKDWKAYELSQEAGQAGSGGRGVFQLPAIDTPVMANQMNQVLRFMQQGFDRLHARIDKLDPAISDESANEAD